ncbi:MAG TPA: IPT/TIG domain-containing protein [Solirubrobacter sp.]|nr:IPT/TIG domain-containing protein [Solirubrobacter sp.]
MLARMIGLGVAAALVAAAPAGATVYPVQQCATYNAQHGTVQVRLAAVNTDVAIVTMPPGDANSFSPPPLDRNQPNQFLPGFTPWDLTLAADSGTVDWRLDGTGLPAPFSTAAAGLPFERPCAYRGPEITAVEPATLTVNGTLTVFGQGLGAGATVTLDGAELTPSAATSNRLDVAVKDTAPGTHDLLVTDADGNQTGCRGCVHVAAPEPAVTPEPVQGPRGETGPPGPAGAPAPAPQTRTAHAKTVRAKRLVTSAVSCPAGTAVLSGGYELAPARGPNPPLVTESRPAGAGWRVTARGAARGKPFKLTAYAVCA